MAPEKLDRTRIRFLPKPDYTRPGLEIAAADRARLSQRLSNLYSAPQAEAWLPELERVLRVHWAHKPLALIEAEKDFDPAERFTEQDAILITYGDLLHSRGRSPLATLADFLAAIPDFKQIFNTLHILPFFPYSSDRGFSVIDFEQVDPQLGSWQDIHALDSEYQLMFDGVFNHMSSESKAFQEMLNGHPLYKDMFTAYSSPEELTPEQRCIIVRPRTSDILTRFDSIEGPVWVWTTFSPDQIDLNFRNPRVLIDVIATLLLYVRQGADLIRLDAITYLWEEPGTPCASLEQTHEVVKLFREVLRIVAPGVALITETNVPHQENVSYFGDGTDEAQMVYNFALPPLVLHTFYKEDATILSEWASELEYPSPTTTFFNILDTHDGIGLMGVKSLLSPDEIQLILQKAQEHGAFVSYKTGESGRSEPYEINSTWYSALNLISEQEDQALQIKRYIASRSIALALRGVPGIYFHGLLGTPNDITTVLQTKSKRDINRQVLEMADLLTAVEAPPSRVHAITHQFGDLLYLRKQHRAFHPNGEQQVLSLSSQVFALLRTSPERDQHILSLTNVTPRACTVSVPLADLHPAAPHWYDLIGQRGWWVEGEHLRIHLLPYDVLWLIPCREADLLPVEPG